MSFTNDTFSSPTDGAVLATYTWGADLADPVGVAQIAHGLAEHAARYDRLAQALVAARYRVHATDHRGHGRSIPPRGVPGDFVFATLASDVAAYGDALKAGAGSLPLFLIAHSMGSIAAQHVLLDRSDLYAGVVLTGSTAVDVLAAGMAASPEPAGLEAFNAGFEQRTGYEWLSRDEAEVDKYVADPLCGFELPPAAVAQLFAGTERLADTAALGGIRPDLPLLIASGQADPLSGDGQLVQLLGQRYRDAGLADVTVTVYPGARHEIFNETNRDEVTTDVLAWLQAHS